MLLCSGRLIIPESVPFFQFILNVANFFFEPKNRFFTIPFMSLFFKISSWIFPGIPLDISQKNLQYISEVYFTNSSRVSYWNLFNDEVFPKDFCRYLSKDYYRFFLRKFCSGISFENFQKTFLESSGIFLEIPLRNHLKIFFGIFAVFHGVLL